MALQHVAGRRPIARVSEMTLLTHPGPYWRGWWPGPAPQIPTAAIAVLSWHFSGSQLSAPAQFREGGFDGAVERRVGVNHGAQFLDGDLRVHGDGERAEHLAAGRAG